MKLAFQIALPLFPFMSIACMTNGDGQHSPSTASHASNTAHPVERDAETLNDSMSSPDRASTGTQSHESADTEQFNVDIRTVKPAEDGYNNVVFVSRPVGDAMFIDVLNLGPNEKRIYSFKDDEIAKLPDDGLGTLKFTASKNSLVFTGVNLEADPKPKSIDYVGTFSNQVLPRDPVNLEGPKGKSTFSFGIDGLMSGFRLEQVSQGSATGSRAGEGNALTTAAQATHRPYVNGDRCIIDIHPIQPPPSASNSDYLVIVSIARADSLTLYAWSLGSRIKSLAEHDGTPVGQIVNGQLATLTFTVSGDKMKLVAKGLKSDKTLDPYPSVGRYDADTHDDPVTNLSGPERVAILSFGLHGVASVLRVETSATPQ